jgi:hypothetical protein
MSRLARRMFRLTACALALALVSLCERLPIRAYSTADGLASNDVDAIKLDSRGFL